jgi:hypothetical protein
MPPTQRLQILGNRQAARLRTLVIERLDVIDIAAMRRHPTTGKGAGALTPDLGHTRHWILRI